MLKPPVRRAESAAKRLIPARLTHRRLRCRRTRRGRENPRRATPRPGGLHAGRLICNAEPARKNTAGKLIKGRTAAPRSVVEIRRRRNRFANPAPFFKSNFSARRQPRVHLLRGGKSGDKTRRRRAFRPLQKRNGGRAKRTRLNPIPLYTYISFDFHNFFKRIAAVMQF